MTATPIVIFYGCSWLTCEHHELGKPQPYDAPRGSMRLRSQEYAPRARAQTALNEDVCKPCGTRLGIKPHGRFSAAKVNAWPSWLRVCHRCPCSSPSCCLQEDECSQVWVRDLLNLQGLQGQHCRYMGPKVVPNTVRMSCTGFSIYFLGDAFCLCLTCV